MFGRAVLFSRTPFKFAFSGRAQGSVHTAFSMPASPFLCRAVNLNVSTFLPCFFSSLLLPCTDGYMSPQISPFARGFKRRRSKNSRSTRPSSRSPFYKTSTSLCGRWWRPRRGCLWALAWGESRGTKISETSTTVEPAGASRNSRCGCVLQSGLETLRESTRTSPFVSVRL